jgi:hypothetical protein
MVLDLQQRKPVAKAAALSSSEEETDDDDDSDDNDDEETDSDTQPAQPAARKPPLAPGAVPRACVAPAQLNVVATMQVICASGTQHHGLRL